MRKIVVVLLLISMITTSAYAVNIFDRALYKKVLLQAIHRYVLVTRVTGQVRYIMGLDGKWVIVGALQGRYQAMYEVQTGRR